MTLASPVLAQGIDLTQGGPIQVTARDGIEWRQAEQMVIAKGDAKAVRSNATVTADRLSAWYRAKGGKAAADPAPSTLTSGASTEGNEVYRLRAEGRVHVYTATDEAWGDQATYDLDQAVLVMTGHALKLTTPSNTLTARDTLEYWAQKRMAVARGDAVVLTNDARRIAADTLVAFTAEPPPPGQNAQPVAAKTQPVAAKTQPAAAKTQPAATKTQPAAAITQPTAAKTQPTAANTQPTAAPAESGGMAAMAGKLERVEAFNNVSIRTPTDYVTGDRGVYVPDSGIARLAGHVRITRGANQINGAEAIVNMATGIATLTSGGDARVSGLIIPNDPSTTLPGPEGPKKAAKAGTKP